ncbi:MULTISPECIES: hypothetical protein [Bradyrhizobium]|uniref:hypothetical protein n=1 Tax=Bradyrhizobium TaxID=374 RepID=UPI001F30A0D5|nr:MULTISPECIES: hypothetical protein [Bradyrhizobium]
MLKKGERPADAVQRLRHRLRELDADTHRVRSSPYSLSACNMMRSKLHGLDGDKPHWIIPGVRTKNKKAEDTVPLSRIAGTVHRSGLGGEQA